MLKSLKMKEIRAKLDRIGKEGGKNFQNDEGLSPRAMRRHNPMTFLSALGELDLDGDWDPEAHDKQMSKLYVDDEGFDEIEKPVWDDDIDIDDIISEKPMQTSKKKKKKKKDAEEVEDGGVDIDVMDADVEKIEDDEEWDGTEETRKRKLDEYMDEIYSMDFNDMVRPTLLQHLI